MCAITVESGNNSVQMEVIFTSTVSTFPRLKTERRRFIVMMKKMLDVVFCVTTVILMEKVREKLKKWVLVD